MEQEDFSIYNGENTILRKAQLRMLSILIEVDKVCRKHNIRYWLSFGTLLGAVRHKGFIPWDDDIDICIMREDYDKLKALLIAELPNNLVFQDASTDKYVWCSYMRVRDRKSYCYYKYFAKQKEQGLWIDIFPFEKVYSMKLVKFINFFYGRTQREIRHFGDVAYNNKFRRYLVRFVAYCLHPFSLCMVGFGRFMAKFNSKGLITNSYPHNANCKVYENDIFPLIDIEFEGHKFLAPKNYDKYLKEVYGDYMKLPPKEKRKSTFDINTIKYLD